METTATFLEEEIIFRKGETSKYAYIIESGKVGIYKENDYGKRILVRILRKSDLFGEMGLIDKYPRSATAIALEKSRLTVVDNSRFAFLSKYSPKFFVILVKTLTNRLRDTLDQLKHEGRQIEGLTKTSHNLHKKREIKK
ncbi:MAG: cyclic nucleotide-binding domain-containing protein [Nitrospinae bacterium]|nr:cyclic nucleotide-binding domain-containing protein [Nitrospinota bacterium]